MTKAQIIERLEKITSEEEVESLKRESSNDDSLLIRITGIGWEKCLRTQKNGTVEAVKKLDNGKTIIVFRY